MRVALSTKKKYDFKQIFPIYYIVFLFPSFLQYGISSTTRIFSYTDAHISVVQRKLQE